MINSLPSMADFDLQGKRVLIRQDLNVPIEHGAVANDARIKASIPTIRLALDRGAAVILLSHLGRPVEGEYDPKYSLAAVAENLTQQLGIAVRLESNWMQGVEIAPGEIVLCENVRFQKGEKANDAQLAQSMAALCDLFVMDAFGTAHRAQSSTCGVIEYAPQACAGPLLDAELKALGKVLAAPEKPVVAVVGGSKVSGKLEVLQSLLPKVNSLILGGGIVNTFLAAKGYVVGKSLYEPELIDTAKSILESASKLQVAVPLPVDVVVANHIDDNINARTVRISEVGDNDAIFDIGPETTKIFDHEMTKAATILWNGPVGVFEKPGFDNGTKSLAHSIANSNAYSLAGGGDTLSAIDTYEIRDDVSYISTGGGAFLEFVEGKTLPAVAALQKKSAVVYQSDK